ncbi:hypothetical protein ACHAXR_008259 [Thalassiosira sp. AJA248-18]
MPFLPKITERTEGNPNASSLDSEDQAETVVADVAAGINSCDGTRPKNQFRLANRIRRWHVTFGNPSLGTYVGNIVTLHPRSRRRQRLLLGDEYYDCSDGDPDRDDDEYDDDDDNSESSDESFSSCSSFGSLVQDDAPDLDMKRTCVMVNVPPGQVPDGVLNLVRGHRPFIEHVRIVIGSSRSEEAEQRRRRMEARGKRDKYDERDSRENSRRGRSQTWACENDVDGGNLDDLVTSFGKASTSNNKSDENSEFRSSQMGTRGSRSTSLDVSAHFPYESGLDGRSYDFDTTTGFEEEKYAAEDHDNEDKNYHILVVLDSEDSAETFVSDLHYRPYTSLDESETCSVYHAGCVKGEDGVSLLGPFFASSTTSTSSPNDSVSPSTKDEHQCPVCLEKMSIPSQSSITTASDASSSILTTVCNHSFHIDCLARWQDSPCPVCRYDHSGLNETLSRCHVCATTVRNYVCLICGVISCANGPSAPAFTPHATGDGLDQAPQAPSHLGHALLHYEESLHAYALDTETQHVWDFAGGGYVHRLLQNSEDGKIVEGIDPRLLEEEGRGRNQLGEGEPPSSLSAMERSSIPTYSSSAVDDEATHRKLEGFAGQYYTLLKSQLEQQRIFYEGRLEAIRREHENKSRNERSSTSDLISALKQERNQLDQRCMTLRRKHKKVSDDAVFLENMNESLEVDKHSFRRQISEAQAELAESKQLTQQLLTPLEEKVSLLMLQLESGFGGDSLDDKKTSAK